MVSWSKLLRAEYSQVQNFFRDANATTTLDNTSCSTVSESSLLKKETTKQQKTPSISHTGNMSKRHLDLALGDWFSGYVVTGVVPG